MTLAPPVARCEASRIGFGEHRMDPGAGPGDDDDDDEVPIGDPPDDDEGDDWDDEDDEDEEPLQARRLLRG
jgi:hypothetical protein